MPNLNEIGKDWVVDEVSALTDTIGHITPSEFNEANRYLPESVTSIPGYIRYAVNPFMREIIDCFDVNSPVREVNVMKGGQITYSTLLESGLFYFMAYIKTLPMMYMTADKGLAKARVENNIIPMLNQSGFGHIIRSSDEFSSRKTGKTAEHLQFEGGGYLVPFGALNADKMRSYSMCVLLKDEIDAWPHTVGKDGDPDALSDYRCKGYWEKRKIFRGSTPVFKGTSKIDAAFKLGDQRHYMVLCHSCSFPQVLRWETKDKKTGVIGGFMWELENGTLILESVCYLCQNCGHAHYEHDKERLFSEDYGAHWLATAKPSQPNIRSYHLPAMYSPIGMQPWYSCVADYLMAYDTEERKVKDIGKYQVFYNSVLAMPFEIFGDNVKFRSVSLHRRAVYRLGQIPNESFAIKYMGSPVLFLTCSVDVHKSNLAVAVFGWTRDARCLVIDYWRFEAKDKHLDCNELSSPPWQRLRELIEETEYTADDGKRYKLICTFIDAGYSNSTVVEFCSDYESGVYPILGRQSTAKNQTIKEFAEFTTQGGTIGYRILVDHYKDRMAPVLRREWVEEAGEQKPYHFNAPVDMTDAQLTELTVEVRRERVDDKGQTYYEWHRPGNAHNELWDLFGYGNCCVEVIAWQLCIQHFELETIDWPRFWDYIEQQKLYYME